MGIEEGWGMSEDIRFVGGYDAWRELQNIADKYIGMTELHSLAKRIREDSKGCAKYLEAL